MSGPEKALHFKDRHEWHKWLQENSQSASEVWLIHCKKGSKTISVSHDDAVIEALCFGWIDGKLISSGAEKYLLRYSPRTTRSVWSKINRERAEQLIASGDMTAAGMAKIEEARKNGLWDAAYTNRKADDMPAALRKALQKNPQALANFNKFANSYRNMYIGWVAAAKTEQTRTKRIEQVVQRSVANLKPGMSL